MAWEWHEGEWVRRTALVADHDALATAVYTLGVNETARRADCSNPMISKLASGKLSSCTVGLATRLAEALGASLEDFFLIKSVRQDIRDVGSGATGDRKTA